MLQFILVILIAPTVIGILAGLFLIGRMVFGVTMEVVRMIFAIMKQGFKFIKQLIGGNSIQASVEEVKSSSMTCKIGKELKFKLSSDQGIYLNQVAYSHGSHTFTIDHLIVGRNGRLVILQDNEMEGVIKGTDRDETWTTVFGGANNFFDNPIPFLNEKAGELEGLLRAKRIPCQKVAVGLVFTSPKTSVDPRISRQNVLFKEDVQNFLSYHLSGEPLSIGQFNELLEFCRKGALVLDESTLTPSEEPVKAMSQYAAYPEELGLPDDYVVLDIETTGLSADKHEIIQMAAYRYRNNQLVDSFSSFVKPRKAISSKIKTLTGITDADVALAQSIEEVLPNFISFLGEDVLVGHKVTFDLSFLSHHLSVIGGAAQAWVFIDTLPLARYHMELPNYKLETIKEALGLTVGSHTADEDCYVCQVLFEHLKALPTAS